MAMNDELDKKKGLIEAALFMSPNAIGIDRIAKLVGLEVPVAVKLLETLMQEFNNKNEGIEIVRLEGGKYKMQVKDEYLPAVKDLAVDIEMSKAVLRTLAVIAFKQPITQSLVVKVRGNKAYEHIKELIDRGFVKSRKFRNTWLLETTRKFDEYFGPLDTPRGLGIESQKKLIDYESSGSSPEGQMGQEDES